MRLLAIAALLLSGCAAPAGERSDSTRLADSAPAASASHAATPDTSQAARVDTSKATPVSPAIPPKPRAPARTERPTSPRDSIIGYDRAKEIDVRDRSKQFPRVTDTVPLSPAQTIRDTRPPSPR